MESAKPKLLGVSQNFQGRNSAERLEIAISVLNSGDYKSTNMDTYLNKGIS